MNSKIIIVVVGPTAVGKTNTSIELAKQLNAEILSADSRQFYKELNIGTSKPTKEELTTIPHHFIDIKSIQDYYSVGDFVDEATHFLKSYFLNKNIILLTGGSGLYINALCYGIDELPKVNIQIREELNNLYINKGIEELQKKLFSTDPEQYSSIDIHNPMRIIRALEVFYQTGKKISTLHSQKKSARLPYHIWHIGLNADRNTLYHNINKRLEIMVNNGLIDEIKYLLEKFPNNPIIQKTIGYKEFIPHFTDHENIDQCLEEAKKNSRNYAKRQLTWFKKNKEITWFHVEDKTYLQDIFIHINNLKKSVAIF